MPWFSISGAVRWNSVEIEFQNPSLAARPSPSASLIISVNLLIKMSCKRFPSFHSDHYQHARLPAEYLSFSPFHTGQWHTSALCMHPMHTAAKKCGQSFCWREHGMFWICLKLTLVDNVLIFEKFAVWFYVLPQLVNAADFVGKCRFFHSWVSPAFFTLGYRQQRRDGINRVVGSGHGLGHGAWNPSSVKCLF